MLSVASTKQRIAALEGRLRASSNDWPGYVEAVRKAMQDSIGGIPSGLPSRRWKTLRYHEMQNKYYFDRRRWKINYSGRRSGKTELTKREGVETACCEPEFSDHWFVFSAPTDGQARKIFWQDLKDLCPKPMVTSIHESGTIKLWNGNRLQIMGLDVPERIEGPPLYWINLDEYANMLERVWPYHVRPALADSGGCARLTGVPEGRNHFYDMILRYETDENWGIYSWWSEEILPAAEIEDLRQTMDEISFNREMRASFDILTGQAYYAFNRKLHCRDLPYDPDAPLHICLDFNVEPGTATYCQDVVRPNGWGKVIDDIFTGVIGEVHIPIGSNTPTVCRKIIADHGKTHRGQVFVYGDPAGGARHTSQEQGTDWDIVRAYLAPVFGDRFHMRVKHAHPEVKVRVNAVNCRLKTADGRIHMLVDGKKAPNTVKDFEGVKIKKGTDGELDKKDDKLTHLTDGLGYMIELRHPMKGVNRTESVPVA